MSVWYPTLWLRWNDALREAGFSPNSLNVAINDDHILRSYAELVRQTGRIPVAGELRRKAKLDANFPSHTTFSRFGGKAALIKKLRDFCAGKPDFEEVMSLLPAPELDPSDELLFSKAPIQGHVYMMQSGRRYKIGFTNSPARRYREVKLELPDPTKLVHSIETDDPQGIEAYWHQRFKSKRVRDTEFFELDATEVAAFKRRKYQ